MTEQESILLEEIEKYLKEPLSEQQGPWPRSILVKMAGWLMQYAPGRYRQLARQLQFNARVYFVKQANESLTQIARILREHGSAAKLQAAVPAMIEQTHKQVDEVVKKVESAEKKSRSFGKRADHEQLPADVQAMYEENLPLVQKQRAMFEKLKLYWRQLKDQQSSASSAPCDIEETCHQLQTYARQVVELNDRRLENWTNYDAYKIEKKEPEKPAISDEPKVDLNSTAASYVSRYLPRLCDLRNESTKRVQFVRMQAKIQERVDIMAASKQWRPSARVQEQLKMCGIKYE